MKSTVPVGTGEKMRAGLDERGLDHVGYVSNPEFLAEGSAVRDFMEPDRIVIGAFDEEDGDAVAGLYASLEAPIVRSDVNSAEMIKLAANAFLMTRISFINEIANVCEATGADVVKVAEGVGLDHRLGPHFLRAGIGYGGSCFPKDSLALKQLASNSGYHFQLLSAVIEVNELQKRRVIGKLKRHLGSLRGKQVALLGLAFKPNTDDMREAPSIVLAWRLLAEGAEVRAWDPVADGTTLPKGVEVVPDGRRRRARRRRGGDRDRVARAQGPGDDRDARGDGEPADHRRAQPARPGGDPPRRASRTRASGARRRSPTSCRRRSSRRPPRRLEPRYGGDHPRRRQGRAARRRRRRTAEVARRGRGQAARRLPGRPPRAGRRDARDLRVRRRPGRALRVASSRASGRRSSRPRSPSGSAAAAAIKFAAALRSEQGDVFALNGDELVDVDFAALLARTEAGGALATIAVAQPKSPFGVVDLDDDDVVHGFSEGGHVPYWVNCGIYVLSEEAIERFPDQGDHESTTFPELAAEGRLRAYRHDGPLADREHAEGAAHRRRARRGASGVARMT